MARTKQITRDEERRVSMSANDMLLCYIIVGIVKRMMLRKIRDSKSEVLRYWFGDLIEALGDVEDTMSGALVEGGVLDGE